MTNAYDEMKARHQKEVNDYPMFFAFTDKQFEESMRKIGLDPGKQSDLDQVCSGPAGMFLRKSDVKGLTNMMARHRRELEDAISADKTGSTAGFMFQMFKSELFNHEFGYTGDTEETLESLGISYETLRRNPTMRKAFKSACKYVMNKSE